VVRKNCCLTPFSKVAIMAKKSARKKPAAQPDALLVGAKIVSALMAIAGALDRMAAAVEIIAEPPSAEIKTASPPEPEEIEPQGHVA
jgi:hypothetical protein